MMKDLGARAFNYGYASPVLMVATYNDDGSVKEIMWSVLLIILVEIVGVCHADSLHNITDLLFLFP